MFVDIDRKLINMDSSSFTTNLNKAFEAYVAGEEDNRA